MALELSTWLSSECRGVRYGGLGPSTWSEVVEFFDDDFFIVAVFSGNSDAVFQAEIREFREFGGI